MPTKLDFGRLIVTIDEQRNAVTYNFRGDVDEGFRHRDVPRIQKPKITMNLEHISNFNSCGIREWVFLIGDLGKLGSLHFERCSVAMVDQINMVPDSLGSAVVDSFFAPYYCTCTVKEVSRLIESSQYQKEIRAHRAPKFTCDNCGKNLAFDALEESYFLFTGTATPRAS
jgi:hypothetical protein